MNFFNLKTTFFPYIIFCMTKKITSLASSIALLLAAAIWGFGFVVVKDSLTAALQSFHAYFGAYGYDHDPTTDYVQCAILDAVGLVRKSEVDDRRTLPEPNAE